MNTLLAQEIYDKALACGYDSCGIVPLDALDFYKERLIKRLEDVPESKEVYAHSKDFLALKEKYPWAQSIVVCTEYFGDYKFPVSPVSYTHLRQCGRLQISLRTWLCIYLR